MEQNFNPDEFLKTMDRLRVLCIDSYNNLSKMCFKFIDFWKIFYSHLSPEIKITLVREGMLLIEAIRSHKLYYDDINDEIKFSKN